MMPPIGPYRDVYRQIPHQQNPKIEKYLMLFSTHSTYDFSLLLATRGRPRQVLRLFDSIMDTARRPDKLEVVLYIDEDDIESHHLSHSHLATTRLIRPRATMGGMHRACCDSAKGRYVLLIGDDNVFRTWGWDQEVRTEFEKYPDGIVLIYGNDLIQGRNMCTAPFLTRTTCQLMGGICPAEYTGEFVDTHILDLFCKLRYWGYDRIIYREDIIIEHLHHVVGKAPYDDTYAAKAPTDENRELFFSLDPQRVCTARKIVRQLSNGKK